MATITDTHQVCECCALMIASGDESSCRDYWGHAHRSCELPHDVLNGDEDYDTVGEWVCDGCQIWQSTYSIRYHTVTLH